LLCALGWRDQCQLLYHKWCCVWSSWWNTQSYEACCRSRDTQRDSVKNYFTFHTTSCWTICIWHTVINTTRNSSLDEIAERYHVNRAIVVKRYQPYTQFPHNVHLISDESW